MVGSSSKGVSPAVIAHDKGEEQNSIESHERDMAADSRKDERAFLKAKKKRDAKALEIANRTADGKQLTESQAELYKSSPAIRIQVNNELKKQGLDIAEMYVKTLKKAYDQVHDKESPMKPDQELKRMRFVVNEAAAYGGIHATADDKKRPDTEIHLHVDEGLYLQIEDNDGNKTKIQAVRQAERTPQTAEIISDTDSDMREEGG